MPLSPTSASLQLTTEGLILQAIGMSHVCPAWLTPGVVVAGKWMVMGGRLVSLNTAFLVVGGAGSESSDAQQLPTDVIIAHADGSSASQGRVSFTALAASL